MTPDNSAFGQFLAADEIQHQSVKTIKAWLDHCGFIVVHDIAFTREAFARFFSRFGDVIRFISDPHAPGYETSDVTLLQGNPDDVVAGCGQLPLHADGGTESFIVDHLFLYASEVSGMAQGGATCLTNHRLANQELPEHLREILFGRRHYMRIITPDAKHTWQTIPVFSGVGRSQRMMIYFPFEAGQRSSWECSVEGLSPEECHEYYRALQAFYRQPRYYYRHQWKQGQLLICDNRVLLHEREPYGTTDQRRVLMRGITHETDREG
ncbi:TauD/TfdA family dioxygenase [Candidatus Pantoea multigeneris]|nr:TauD/TfdA family dioxygenase [Pantoea multigeneris]